MEFSAIDIIHWQACERRHFLEQSWRVNRRRPKAALDAALRHAVYTLSTGHPLPEVRAEARASLMAEAADPGLAMPEGVDPYVYASDLAAILDTVLTATSQLTLLQLTSIEPIEIAPSYTYRPLSFADDSGCLHRWLTVDRWDDDALTRELHSWVTAADMAVCDAPLTLHVVVIGQRRGSRQHSPWCRAHEQPIIRRLRFQRTDRHQHRERGVENKPPAIPADWREVWYADLPKPDPAAWVAAMHADAVMPRLLLHPAIAEFPAQVRHQTLDQLRALADSMARTAHELRHGPAGRQPQDPGQPGPPEPAMSLPMARGACDGLVPCPFAMACYRVQPEYGIATLGAYSRRAASARDASRRESSSVQPRTSGIAGAPSPATTSDGDGSRTGSVAGVASS
jgi:hypothetical protein